MRTQAADRASSPVGSGRRNILAAVVVTALAGPAAVSGPAATAAPDPATLQVVNLALPILPGKTEAARAFLAELEGTRREDYHRADRAIGVKRELWFLQPAVTGDLLLLYMEGPDLAKSFEAFIASRDPLFVLFKERLLDVTGQDWSRPPDGPGSELLSRFEAEP